MLKRVLLVVFFCSCNVWHCTLQDSQLQNTADSKDFKVAVARTRQAVSVQKAIGFMDASSPAKYSM